MIGTLFTDIATGLGALVPAFFEALLTGFSTIFIDSTAETIKLTPVGDVALAFIIIGMVYKIAPTVVGWLRLSMAKRKRRKSRR